MMPTYARIEAKGLSIWGCQDEDDMNKRLWTLVNANSVRRRHAVMITLKELDAGFGQDGGMNKNRFCC